MKYLCGIDLGIYDSSIYVLISYDEKEDKLYITKQKELTQEQQTRILQCYYSNPPKMVETFSLGGGLMCKRAMNDKAYNDEKENYNNRIVLDVSSILELDYNLDSVAIDFDKGTKRWVRSD